MLSAAVALLFGAPLCAQDTGSVRGVVRDGRFDRPLSGVAVRIVETGQSAETGALGDFSISPVPEGTYTLVFTKESYAQRVRSGQVVRAGRLTEIDTALAGDLFDLEEYEVEQGLTMGGGSEASLLQLRFDSSKLIDSVSAELMSRAGASDAASALRLVSGATVQDGKAVIRGLPDRYVVSLLNGVRLPSSDTDTRAVRLDQFPAVVIESIQVSKSFMPDQQGDATGGSVDVRLKGVPEEEFFFRIKGQMGWNSNVRRRDDFLTYRQGGVNQWGRDDGRRDPQPERNDGSQTGFNWEGAVGVDETKAPLEYKWSATTGGKYDIGYDTRVGGFASFFYERDNSYQEDAEENFYWLEGRGQPLTPRIFGQEGVLGGTFATGLFDIEQATQSVQWGGLGSFGIETDNHSLTLSYLYTRTTQDLAQVRTDTRGKEYFFPGHDPNDPTTPGHNPNEEAAPYLRLETLEYNERTLRSLQLRGRHELEFAEFGVLGAPVIDWTASAGEADSYTPDKRLFGAQWLPGRSVGGLDLPPRWEGYKPTANFSLGNLQRIWQTIEERSEQFNANLELPFDQWSDERGFLKFGYFVDDVKRTFDQDSFTNFQDNSFFNGNFDEPWSSVFPFEDHGMVAAETDVDYVGQQNLQAYYGMAELPLTSWATVRGGVRFEETKISVRNDATGESEALWFDQQNGVLVGFDDPDAADADFEQNDSLPAVGLDLDLHDDVTLRFAYSETVARQVFKELTPTIQQEFLGGPIFIGNQDLQMSAVQNYDVRLDYKPYLGGLISVSAFHKDIEDPIEFVQRGTSQINFTTVINYPRGKLRGLELEVRQDLGRFVEVLDGLSLGGNATFFDSEVTLSDFDRDFIERETGIRIDQRDMVNTPDYLYNLYATYDVPVLGTQLGLFYTVQGDTLLEGAGVVEGEFVPDLYAAEFDTLNLSVTQRFGNWVTLQFQAKNLTDPAIQRVYRTDLIPDDVLNQSFRRGIDYSFSLGGELRF